MNYNIHNNINQREKYDYLPAFTSQIQAAAYESYLKIPNFNSYKGTSRGNKHNYFT